MAHIDMMLLNCVDASQQAVMLSKQVADCLRLGIENNGSAALAVPGGTTPAEFLNTLAGEDLPWDKVTLTLTDERQVSMDHARSNAGLILKHFITAQPQVQFLPLWQDGEMPASIPELDAVVLGMGVDGHFASIFPNMPLFEQAFTAPASQPCMQVKPPDQEARVTLVAQKLLTARYLFLLFKGSDKLKVLESPQLQLPIHRLMAAEAGGRFRVFYCD